MKKFKNIKIKDLKWGAAGEEFLTGDILERIDNDIDIDNCHIKKGTMEKVCGEHLMFYMCTKCNTVTTDKKACDCERVSNYSKTLSGFGGDILFEDTENGVVYITTIKKYVTLDTDMLSNGSDMENLKVKRVIKHGRGLSNTYAFFNKGIRKNHLHLWDIGELSALKEMSLEAWEEANSGFANVSVVHHDSEQEITWMKEIFTECGITKERLDKAFNAVFEVDFDEYIKAINSKVTPKKTTQKTFESEFPEVKLRDIEFVHTDAIQHFESSPDDEVFSHYIRVYTEVNTEGGKIISYESSCPICGKKSIIEDRKTDFNCCGVTTGHTYNVSERNVLYLEECDGGILYRCFKTTPSGIDRTIQLVENLRVLISKDRMSKMIFELDENKEHFVRSRKRVIELGEFMGGRIFAFQTQKEVREIIESTDFKYANLESDWFNNEHDSIVNFSSINPKESSYIMSYIKNNNIERLTRIGLNRIVKTWCEMGAGDIKELNNTNIIDWSKGKPADMLGVTKPVVKYLAENNVSIGKLKLVQEMVKLDKSLDPETIKTIQDFEARDGQRGRWYSNRGEALNGDLNAIARSHKIKYSKQLEYLENVFRYQCIDKGAAASIWKDYLDFANKIGVNLKDSSKKFPSSLKREHDKASYVYTQLKENLSNELFVEMVEKYSHLEFKGDKYSVILPKTKESMVDEGYALNHCVSSYIDKVIDGDTNIVFIRKNSDLDVPFYTAEVLNGVLSQVRGFSNKSVEGEELKSFIDEWADKKIK